MFTSYNLGKFNLQAKKVAEKPKPVVEEPQEKPKRKRRKKS